MRRFRLVLLVAGVFAETAMPEQTVLVINSYHHGYSWSDSIIEGIESAFSGSSVRLRHEYMDMKHIDSREYRHLLRDLYHRKYRDQQPAVIIGTDIVALQFLTDFHDELFDEVPTVFATVHDSRPELPTADWWTGAYSELPVLPTLHLIRSLQPDLLRLLVVAEDTEIGRNLETQTRTAVRNTGTPIEVLTLMDNDVDNLLVSIATMSADSAVLYTLVSHDAGNVFVPPEESVGRLVRESNTPVYGMLEIYAEMGIVGGALLDGHDLGRCVANQALSILDGTAPADIPVVLVDSYRTVCDWQQLARFGISQERLPAGVSLIHAPGSTVQISQRTLVFGTVIISTLVLVVTALASLVHRQHRTQTLLRDEQARCRRAFEAESLAAEIATYLNQLEGPERVSMETITGYLDRAMGIDDIVVETDPSLVTTDSLADGTAPNGVNPDLKSAAGNMSTDDPIVVEDAKHLPHDSVPILLRNTGARSFVLTTLAVNQQRLGTVAYARSQPGAWPEADLALLSTVTDMLAATWFRFRITAANARAERRNSEARAVLERTARLASIGVVAAGITHEIAQPLNYIKMTTDTLRYSQSSSSGSPAEVSVPARKLTRIGEAVDRIERVVTHMREYWSAPQKLDVQPVDVKVGVTNAVNLVQQQLTDHTVHLALEITDSSTLVRSSLIDIEQVVVNLLSNAIQALNTSVNPSKHVLVRLSVANGSVVLTVEDNGPGIGQQYLECLFDPFFSSRTSDQGMGLGLAIVESIVRRAGGRICAENGDRGGARFVVRLPRVESEVLS